MFSCFHDAYSKEKNKGIQQDKNAEKWYDLLIQIETCSPEWEAYLEPEEKTFKKKIYDICVSSYLDNFIMLIIILNLFTMAMTFDSAKEIYNTILENINLVFTGIFILECGLKIYGLGVTRYFHGAWNQFDSFVVGASIVDLIVTYASGTNSQFLKSFQIIRVLRVLRVTRVLRLVRSLKGLAKLIQTLKFSIGALANIFILMMLLFFIFSIMGCYLFEEVTFSKYSKKYYYVNEYYNFDNFYNAFLLVFKATSGESWPNMMLEYSTVEPIVVGSYVSIAYFVGMIFLCAVIMLNLFILIVLQQYDEFHSKDENPIERFSEMLDTFKPQCNKLSSTQDNGIRMDNIKINTLLETIRKTDLAIEIGIDKDSKSKFQESVYQEKLKKTILELKFIV
jgi:hypothetical protein